MSRSLTDAFIVDAVRTPVGRYGGALSTVRPDDLAALALRALLQRTGAPAQDIDDVILGCANQAGEDNRNVARMALLLAGMPVGVPGVTVNRLCGSGLQAVIDAARLIQTGEADLVFAGGVESMSRAPLVMAKSSTAYARGNTTLYDSTLGWRFENPRMQELYGCEALGQTAEKVAILHKVSRQAQDTFALRSQQAWGRAQAAGLFSHEICPVDVAGPKGAQTRVDADEHPRPTLTEADLEKLQPVFRNDGTVTAGNASGLNDGAAAVLLASAAGLAKLAGPANRPLARVATSAVVGVEPDLMGLGPIPASEKALSRVNLHAHQIDLVEINEAFAAQCVPCIEQIGFNPQHVNVNGGAIAIGHPLGCSGARLTTTIVHEMARRQATWGLITMCIGVGQGISLVLEGA